MSRLRELPLRPEVVPGLVALGLFVVWGAADGGQDATTWYPGGLLLLGLIAVVAANARGLSGRIPRPTAIAIGFGLAFALWCFISIAWADAKGPAWDGANRALVFVGAFVLFALLRWRPSSALLILGGYSVAIAGLGAVTLLDVASATDPVLEFIDDRWVAPIGYHNASAALYLAAIWPALFLASRRETPWPVRGLLLAAAGTLVQLAIIPQSRGSAVALPLALVLYVALVPGRARFFVTALPVAIATVLAAPALLDVYEVGRADGDLGAALDDAVRAVGISFLALAVVGCAGAAADRRISASADRARNASLAINGTAAVGALVALVIAFAAIGNPVTWVEDRWHDFKTTEEGPQTEGSRFGSGLGSNRYDFWRVAVEEFADAPLTGRGIDQFPIAYLEQRRSIEEPADPHGLPLRLISETGLVGSLLFFGFVAAAVVAALRARRYGRTELARAIPALALVGFGYWFIHGLGDWLWLLPALSAPAFAWLGLAGRIEEEPHGDDDGQAAQDPSETGDSDPPPARTRARVAALAGGLAVALVVGASFVLPWSAARDVDQATEQWADNPKAAFDRLERARELNFLSDQPDLVAGAIAVRLDDLPRARAHFAAAVERNPHSWYGLLELGAIEAVEGRTPAALAHLRRADELNPGDPVIDEALRAAQRERPLALRAIDRRMLERLCARFGRTTETPDC